MFMERVFAHAWKALQQPRRKDLCRQHDGQDRWYLEALGIGSDVPLPRLTRNQRDTLTFEFNGESRRVLDYCHFSVLMSRSRRL